MRAQLLDILNEALWVEGEEHTVQGKIIVVENIVTLFQKFEKWKDVRLLDNRIVMVGGFYFYAKKYTLVELFGFWYEQRYTG